MNNFVYEIGNALYINLTNKCTNKCSFCIRNEKDGLGGCNLWLDREPSAEDVINAIKDPERYDEIVFCGYGEPLIKISETVKIAEVLKQKYNVKKIRINTNGHANLYHGYNVIPDLEGLVDIMSISLNAPNAERYNEICISRYGREAFDAVINFARESIKYIPEVILSVVDIALKNDEIKQCEDIARKIGAQFRLRQYY